MSRPVSNEMDWIQTVTTRLERGEAAAVIKDAQISLKQHPGRFEDLLTLASAYSWLGTGNEAEPYARQALEEIQRRGTAEKGSDWGPRYLDLAYLAMFDAVMLQGRFQEAARLLESYATHSPEADLMWAYTVLGYYMDGNNEDASSALRSLFRREPSSVNVHTDAQIRLSTKVRVMIDYIHTQLFPSGQTRPAYQMDTENRTRGWAISLDSWEDEARRNAHNPYGARLAGIIVGIQDQQLRHALNFADKDLAANRNGRLTNSQLLHLMWQTGRLLLFAGVLVTVVLILTGGGGVVVCPFLLVYYTVLFLVMAPWLLIVRRNVRVVEGRLRKYEEPSGDPREPDIHHIKIRGLDFSVPYEVFNCFMDGSDYRVFYTSFRRQVVAAERIRVSSESG